MKFEKNTILCGDCIELLNQADAPFADLIFADPPFNIGYKYDKYHDKLKKDKYLAWTRDWMAACKKALKPAGSFYIAIGDDYAANVKIIADQLGLHMRNWIIWHYTFGQQTKTKFARAHTHIFYFVKDPVNFTFNDHAVRVPSDRQLIYNDKRSNNLGKMPDDVWNTFSRVCGTFKERQGWHPCQMPVILLSRIIAASSNPGDTVIDPFIGSGTTAEAAAIYGRNYIGIDISSDYCKNVQNRLKNVDRENILNLETKRLYIEMGVQPSTILENGIYLKYFLQQLKIRLNGSIDFDENHITKLLNEKGSQ